MLCRLAGWPAACHCPPPTLFQQNDASQRRQERGIVHSTTRATTHGNSRAPPPDLTGLCCWPHTPPAGFPLSATSPAPALHISQLKSTCGNVLSVDDAQKLVETYWNLQEADDFTILQAALICMLVFLSKQKSHI